MAKKKKLGKYVATIKVGHTRVKVHGKTRRAAGQNAARFVSRHMKNVNMGFYDSTGFHPVRASGDYAPYKAGEFPRKGKSPGQRMAAERRAKARMAT